MTILLVRHCRAGRRDRWTGDDRLRPLTKRGREQADRLPALLAPWMDARVRPRLVASPWVRCVQSLEPLARAFDLEVTIDDALGEGMGPKASDAMASWMEWEPTVLCSHGDVIDDILMGVVASGADLGSFPRTAKGAVWVLDGDRSGVRAARYLPPSG